MEFPSRDIVRPNGIYDKALEPLWVEALDAYYASLPIVETGGALPGMCQAYKGKIYFRDYDPNLHGSHEDVAREVSKKVLEDTAKKTAKETARQAELQEKVKLRDDIEKASTVPSLKAIMVKALERLGAI